MGKTMHIKYVESPSGIYNTNNNNNNMEIKSNYGMNTNNYGLAVNIGDERTS